MELFKREKYFSKIRLFYQAGDIIKVITGVRRCGKSSLMETILQELLYSGVKRENIIKKKTEKPQKIEYFLGTYRIIFTHTVLYYYYI